MWTVGVVIWVVLACVFRATTKKGRQLFGEENCMHLQRKSWLCPCVYCFSSREFTIAKTL